MTTRVAIYGRVSTGEQSPEAQLRELRLYAEHRGFPITREYVDQASGDVRKRRRAQEFEGRCHGNLNLRREVRKSQLGLMLPSRLATIGTRRL